MPAERTPKSQAKKSRKDKNPLQKELDNDTGEEEEEEDFSELMQHGGDAEDEEGDPYDCGYIDNESNFEDLSAMEEKITPAELATRCLANNTDFIRKDQVHTKVPTPAERAYYREVWGFDPVTAQLPLEGVDYRLEAWFPLVNDPGLAAVGVEIGARVDVVCPEKKANKPNTGERIYNRIVFRRKGAEAAVHCAHTVLYSISTGKIHEEMNKQLRGSVLTFLPAWGHFAALKSYVAAMAEEGIGMMLQAAWKGSPSNTLPNSDYPFELTLELSFGFNGAMQGQVLRAIRAVAPIAAAAIWREWFMNLLDEAPTDWVINRRVILLDLIKKAFTHVYDSFKKIGDLNLRDPALPLGVEAVVEELRQNAPHEWLIGHRKLLEQFFGTENRDIVALLFGSISPS